MKICFRFEIFFCTSEHFRSSCLIKSYFFSKFKLLIASKILKFQDHLHQLSIQELQETFTCDWAAKLYISFGLTFFIKFNMDEASVKSPYKRTKFDL